MNKIKIVSRETLGNSRWIKSQNHAYAANDNFVPLTLRELGSAGHAMPICLAKTPDGFQLGALTGLETGENLFVGRDGVWLGAYIPLAYTSHPFRMVRLAQGGEALGITEENVIDEGKEGQEGEPFFDEAGKPTSAIQEIASKLGEYAQQVKITQAACSMLVEKDLLEPWPLRIQQEAKYKIIGALYRISETKLREIPVTDLGELRASGALLLAYAQLLSMTQVQLLGPLARNRSLGESNSRALSANIAGNHGVVSFDNL